MGPPLELRSRGAAGLRGFLEDLPGSVRALRWILPLAIFLFVLVYEVFQNAVSGSLGSPRVIAPDLLVYGLVGPMVTWWTLTWIANSLVHREQVDAQIRELNQQLEAEVEARTQELVRANEELREADQLKSNFMSMISHELRAPLTNIQGALEILIPPGSEPDPPTTKEMLGIIEQQSQRLVDLVEDVLRISRIQAGRLVLRPTQVEIGPLLSRVAAVFESETANHRFRVRLDNDAASVWADRDRVEEILSYLLDNAVKFSPQGGTILIDVSRRGEDQVLSVSDPGVGIPARDLDRIFDKFHRVDSSDAKETYGHGLGLYLARQLVEAHGGRIWAESRLKAGSTFYFTLPTVSPSEQESTTEAASSSPRQELGRSSSTSS